MDAPYCQTGVVAVVEPFMVLALFIVILYLILGPRNC